MARASRRCTIAASALLAALLAAALLCCAPRGAAALWGAKQPSPEEALLEWLKEKGGESHATIATRAGKVRTTWATKALKQHDLIAKIPMREDVAIWFPADYADFADLGAIVARELALGQSSAFAPYLAALPMLKAARHTASFETFPPEYLHLIKSDLMSKHITSTQAGTLDYWAAKGTDLIQDGVTLDLLRAALVTVATRYFGITHGGATTSVMIPLLDFANHDEGCKNYYEYLPCSYTHSDADRRAKADGKFAPDDVGRDELCCFWFAGTDVPEGGELCNRYGYMAPDQAFFQYGFVLRTGGPPDLSRADAAFFTAEHIYGSLAHVEPAPFDGHAEALRDEVKRLALRMRDLFEAGKGELVTPVAPTDAGGVVLAGLKALRLQRLEAIENEILRLQRRADEKDAAAATGARPRTAPAASSAGDDGDDAAAAAADGEGEGVEIPIVDERGPPARGDGDKGDGGSSDGGDDKTEL